MFRWSTTGIQCVPILFGEAHAHVHGTYVSIGQRLILQKLSCPGGVLACGLSSCSAKRMWSPTALSAEAVKLRWGAIPVVDHLVRRSVCVRQRPYGTHTRQYMCRAFQNRDSARAERTVSRGRRVVRSNRSATKGGGPIFRQGSSSTHLEACLLNLFRTAPSFSRTITYIRV